MPASVNKSLKAALLASSDISASRISSLRFTISSYALADISTLSALLGSFKSSVSAAAKLAKYFWYSSSAAASSKLSW